MYHEIEFVADLWVDMERSPKHPLERQLLRRGSHRRVQLRPHVIESPTGLIETADLYFEEGTIARGVPFEKFAFAE